MSDMSTLCEAAVMAWAVFEDEDVPSCDMLGEIEHSNAEVSYLLCVGCNEALCLFLDLGRRA